MKNRKSACNINRLQPVVGFLTVVGIWSIARLILGDTRMPSPWLVIRRFIDTVMTSPEIQLQGAGSKGFLPHVFATLLRYITGTLSGTLAAFIALFLVARWKTCNDIIVPIINILRAIPPLALAPFLLLWFGTTPLAVIGVAIFYTFVMVFIPGVEAINRVDPTHVNFAKTLGANKTSITSEVIIPSITPSLAGPIKVAFNWAWGLVIVGELLGARSGIGRILNAFLALTATDLVIVGIVWILLLAIVSEQLVGFILKNILRWAISE